MSIKEKFGQRVRAFRLQRGLSQEAFAHKAGLDRTYVFSIEKGKRNVSISVVEKIAVAFEVEISELFDKIEDKNE